MQSCLCFSRLGKPLLRSSGRPWSVRRGVSSSPNHFFTNGRFSCSGQPKLPDDSQEKLQAVEPRPSHRSPLKGVILRKPTGRSFHIRRLRADLRADKNKLRLRLNSRPTHKKQAKTTNTVPQETTPLSDNAPLVTPHFSCPITKQTDEALADTSIPFLGAEDDQWTPGIVLARILEMKDPSERERYYIHIRTQTAALSLPILTVHYLLRGHFARSTWTPYDFKFHWKARDFMRPRGITWSKVAQWLWVLSGPTPNEMTERLLSKPFHRKEILKPTHRPPFILLEILRRDISKVKTLEMLISYTRDHVLNLVDTPRSSVPNDQAITSAVFKGTSESDDASSLKKNQGRTITNAEKFGIEENAFAILISRLLYQTRRIWPSAMVDIAHLIVRYMQSSSVTNASPLKTPLFIRFCKMNNYFLRLLALPSSIEPMQSMAYNWEAQKLLLELAGQFDPPLRLDQASYRAVVQVLAATKKSRRESRSMTFRNRSWPPWRVEQDGMDAQRSQEEDFSRVISAIMRSRESGYTQDDQLSIFGGVDTDGTPTIHTRKLLKSRSLDSSTRARDNHDDEGRVWAARIEATRDVYEGWGAFSEFCKKGGRPTISMYLAMFQKINYESKRSALQLDLHVPPGDAREVYPVSDDNFSEFYKSRLQPPTIQNLYKEMKAAGIVPSGRCLRFLLQHARTVDEGLGYLLDSGIHERVVAYLANGGESQIPPDVVAQVSIPILADFISLICRFAPRLIKTSFDSELEMAEGFRSPTKRSSSPARSETWTIREARAIQHSHPRDPLTHAAFLLKSWRPKFRPAWYALLKCLAREDIVMVRNFVTDSSRTFDNHELAWRVTRAVLEDFHSCDLELDPEGFRLVCQTFTKYAEAAFNESQRHREGLIETSQIIKAECAKLTNGGVEVPSKVNARLRYIMEGAHLHAYVRAMGLIGDHAAITSLLEWMVRNHEELDAIASLAANGQRMLRQTIVAIKAFCDVSEHAVATAQPLVEQVESWGGWPDEEEVEYYLNRGHDHVQDAGTEPDDDEEDD